MTNNKERILQMVKEGIIDVEEGLKLLEALTEEKVEIKKTQQEKKMLRVKVDSKDGDVIRVNVPISLIKAGANLANQIKIDGQPLDTKGVDVDLIMKAIEEGMTGEIVDVQSADGDVIKVFVD
jgi:hypothetical protein